jgi:tripartite-type tricarboxylate transporter receptor subunit TctC
MPNPPRRAPPPRTRRRCAAGLAPPPSAPAPAPRTAARGPPRRWWWPYGTGGGTDITGREFRQLLAQELGQTVVVDNRGGAAGHVGSVGVARSRPDGATLLFAVSTNIVVNPHMQRGDRINLATALAPVAQVSAYQYVLVVNPEVPARTLPELIAHVRGRPPGEVAYSSAASATPTTSPACCSPKRPASAWSTSPTAARRRRCSTSWRGGWR